MAAKTTAKKTSSTGRYYVVNPAGAIHEVTREIAAHRLRQPGWRKATPDELKALENAGGNQRWDSPLTQPWNPEPEAIDVEL